MNACRRVAVVSTLTVLVLGAGTPVAGAQGRAGEPPTTPAAPLAWADCALSAEAAGVECATADLPMDYDEPDGEQVRIAVARVPATDPAGRAVPPSRTCRPPAAACSPTSTRASTSWPSTPAASGRARPRSTAR